VIIPVNDRGAALVPLRQFIGGEWLEDATVKWSEDFLTQARSFPEATPAIWAAAAPDSRVPVVVEMVESELRQSRARPRGKAFEALIAAAFAEKGYAVQGNVRLLGADADLVALSSDRDGRVEMTIVECKDYRSSSRSVGVSEVMRLFGFGQALGLSGVSARTLLVTSTQMSAAGSRMATLTRVETTDLQSILDWTEANRPAAASGFSPVVKIATVRADGRLRLPVEFRRYLDLRENVVVMGRLDRMELYARHNWVELVGRRDVSLADAVRKLGELSL
jgi:hypothetical protein